MSILRVIKWILMFVWCRLHVDVWLDSHTQSFHFFC